MTRERAGGEPSTTVRPLPMPLPLALLRGLFTVAGWMISAAPLAFLALLVILVVESLLAVVHVPAFSTSDYGDRLIGLMLGAGAMVSGAALLVTVFVWTVLPAIELHLARAGAPRARLSAQDGRRLVVPAARRAGLLLAVAAVGLLAAGAVVGLLAEQPGDGLHAVVFAGLGLSAAVLSLFVRRRTAGSSADLIALEAVWPPVESTPEQVTVILARERRREEDPANDVPMHGRRRSDARLPADGSSLSAWPLALVGAGITGLVLSDVLEYDGPLLAVPFALLLAAVGLGALVAIRRVQSASRTWARETSAENAPRASAAVYTRRHPALLPAAMLAMTAAAAFTAALTAHWLGPTTYSSVSLSTSSTLGALGVTLAVVSIGVSAIEHRGTRAWRERFLLARQDLDPFWCPDLHHDGLQSIHGWLNGRHAPPHGRRTL